MEKISFEMLYQKSLQIEQKTEEVNDFLNMNHNMSQQEQIEYLKKLGSIKYNKEDSKVHVYSRKINDIDFGVYMIKVPYIKSKIEEIDVSIEYLYRTCIVAIKEDKSGVWTLDNILLYQDKDFNKVEQKYNELYSIVSEKNVEELFEIINTAIDDEISKNG